MYETKKDRISLKWMQIILKICKSGSLQIHITVHKGNHRYIESIFLITVKGIH